MSGAGSATETDLLRSGQVSKRMVQLRAILDLAERDAPEAARKAGFHDSFAALAAVQRHSPAVVADLLSGPQAGAWAARCLRRLAGTASTTPVWIHLAHLGSLALVAATRSGMDIEVLVPVRSGQVSLPTLGLATADISEQWSLAHAKTGDPVLLNGAPPRDWQPISTLRTDSITLPLDETDAYWTCFGLPLRQRLTEAEADRWRRQLDAALTVLAERHEDRHAAITAAIRCLVPVSREGRFGGLSASSADSPGAVALTDPAGPQRLAATLVHEVQHFRLSALHDLIPLHHNETDVRVYSPWRNDPRGYSGLLHGMYAFLGVADFWSREWRAAGRAAELMYAKTLRQLRLAFQILANATSLTQTGMALVGALGMRLRRLPETGLGEDACRMGDDLVAHHLALWRLRHIVPDPAEVSRLTQAWLREEPVAPPADPRYHTTLTAVPGGDSPLFRLATEWIEDPETTLAMVAKKEMFEARHPGADPGDLSLLVGDYVQAQATRLADIAGSACGDAVWASLSVAHSRLYDESSASAVAVRPELVRAAWRKVVATTGGKTDRLAGLLSRYIGGTSTSDSIRR